MALSNEAGRELLRASQSKGKAKVSVDPKVLENILRKDQERQSPAQRGLAAWEVDKPVEGQKKEHKYHAKEEIDTTTGKKAKSNLQMKHEKEYRLMLKEGIIACYCPEVEISLVSPRTGGKHTYRCDHLLIHWDGLLEYIDSKGVVLPEFKKKANWMERQFLPKMLGAGIKITFKARFKDHTHTYESRPLKAGK